VTVETDVLGRRGTRGFAEGASVAGRKRSMIVYSPEVPTKPLMQTTERIRAGICHLTCKTHGLCQELWKRMARLVKIVFEKAREQVSYMSIVLRSYSIADSDW